MILKESVTGSPWRWNDRATPPTMLAHIDSWD